MGYSTVIEISNDGIHKILEDSDDFCRKIEEAVHRMKKVKVGHGGYANLATVHEPTHTIMPVVYVKSEHRPLTALSRYLKESTDLVAQTPFVIDELIATAKKELRQLEDYKFKLEANKKK